MASPPGDSVDLGKIQAVLFDMDGTLVESDAAVERAWTRWAEEYDVDRGSVLAIAHGVPAIQTVRRIRADLDAEAVAAAVVRQHELQYDDLADVVPAKGAAELLAALARLDIPWAVVTSADTRLAKARLGAANFEPPVLITVDDISRGKPDPEGYLLAAARLGVDVSECLVVEDAAPGIAAGRAAGALVAGLKGLASDLTIEDLAQLVGPLTTAAARPTDPNSPADSP